MDLSVPSGPEVIVLDQIFFADEIRHLASWRVFYLERVITVWNEATYKAIYNLQLAIFI